MKIINCSQKSSILDIVEFLDPTPLTISPLFCKNLCTKAMVLQRFSLKQLLQMFPRNYPKRKFFKNKIANIPGISLNEKINLLQMLSLTFQTLWTGQNSFFCCLVMCRFHSQSKNNSQIMIFFPYWVTYTCHLQLLRKLKN